MAQIQERLYVFAGFRAEKKKKKVVAMGWDNASYSVHPFEQSSKSLRVCTCDLSTL